MRGLGMRKPLHAAVVTALNTPNTLFANGEQGAWFEPWAQNALAERRNLLNHSQDLTNAAWTKQSATATVESTVPAPNGTLTANRINVTTAGNAAIIKQNIAVSGAKLRTFSVHVRTGNSTDTGVLFEAYAASSYNDFSVVFDTATGAFTQAAGWLNSTNGVDLKDLGWAYGSVPLANGWYRVWVTMPVVNEVYTVGVWAFSPTAAKYMLAWGVQVENGPLSDYQSVVTWTEAEKIAVMQRDYAADITMFQDAAGTTPVTAMEQPVGLMLDKRLGLVRGAELVANGDFANGTTGWSAANATLAAVNGELEVTGTTSTARAVQSINLTANKAYEVRASARPGTSGVQTIAFFSAGFANNLTFTAVNGQIRGVFVPTASGLGEIWLRADTGSAFFDNISVRELPGNHASQTTTTARPLLSARKNLQLSSENFSVAPWARTNTTVTANAVAAPDGSMTGWRWDNTPNLGSHVTASVAIPSGATGTRTVRAKAISGTGVLAIEIARDGVLGRVEFNLIAGTVAVNNVIGSVSSITPVGNGWYDCVTTFTASGAGANQFQATYIGAFGSTPVATAIGVMFSQVEYGSTATRYQRVNSATDYDWVGFPAYLKFDGVDDFLQTGSINFSTINEMTVIAGVRTLSGSAASVVELGNTGTPANGFGLFAPISSDNYAFRVVDAAPTAAMAQTSATYPEPTLNVVTGVGKLGGGNSASIRVNGSLMATAPTVTTATGLGNGIVHIGRRIGSLIPFNGNLYQLIIIGALVPEGKLVVVERQAANKTGVTLQ